VIGCGPEAVNAELFCPGNPFFFSMDKWRRQGLG
jgi:hypothetical protein